MRVIQTGNLKYKEPLSANTNDWVYNGLDCCVTVEICNELLSQLDNTTRNTYEFSKELQGPVLSMSMQGVKIDQRKRGEVLANYKNQMSIISDQLNSIIKEGIGLDLNWRSPAQLKILFYKVLNLPEVKQRNANGIWAATVDRDALEHLEQYMLAEPLCIRLLLLRDLSKKVEFLETKIDKDGRIRCNFNIAGTKIGRLASSVSDFGTGRNLQNVDREERAILISDEGKKFANLDLEQADARNLGAICWNNFVNSHGEKFAGAYLNACESSDLHIAVSKLVWPKLSWTNDPVADKEVAGVLFYRQDSYRQTSKKLGHATNYLESVRSAAKRMKMVQKIIQDFQKQYFEGFPCIPAYHDWVRQEIRDSATLTTLFGRRRKFYGRQYDETTVREAVAYSPASMTADQIDTGLIRLFKANKVDLLLQVHDSLLIQYDEDREEEIIPWAMEQLKINFELANGRSFHVPVDCKVGWNWGEYDEKKNVDGLIKWKGLDKRKRTPSFKLSVANLLI